MIFISSQMILSNRVTMDISIDTRIHNAQWLLYCRCFDEITMRVGCTSRCQTHKIEEMQPTKTKELCFIITKFGEGKHVTEVGETFRAKSSPKFQKSSSISPANMQSTLSPCELWFKFYKSWFEKVIWIVVVSDSTGDKCSW